MATKIRLSLAMKFNVLAIALVLSFCKVKTGPKQP
jgi:hypothetical protein